SITCPGDTNVECDASIDPSNTGTATASGGCTTPTVTHSDSIASGNCAGSHVITRTWKATDNCGNFSTCPQTITVTDTTGPVISCPADKAIDCSASILPANTGTGEETDDFKGRAAIIYSVTQASDACVGSNVITLTWETQDNFSS